MAPPRDSTRLSLALNGSGPGVLADSVDDRVGNNVDDVDAAVVVLAVVAAVDVVNAADVDIIVVVAAVEAVGAVDVAKDVDIVDVDSVVVAFTKDVVFA